MDGGRELVHGTAIALGRAGVLIRGNSGSGKSDLALRCLAVSAAPLLSDRACLVADDQVVVRRIAGRIIVSPPQSICGKLEVRGLGIIPVPFTAEAELVLIADLVAPGAYERLPVPAMMRTLLGLDLEAVAIDPIEASAPLKLLLALDRTRRKAQVR